MRIHRSINCTQIVSHDDAGGDGFKEQGKVRVFSTVILLLCHLLSVVVDAFTILDQQRCDPKDDSIQWWKQHAHIWPTLFKMTRDSLLSPALVRH
jgi:hypothetical protein